MNGCALIVNPRLMYGLDGPNRWPRRLDQGVELKGILAGTREGSRENIFFVVRDGDLKFR